MAKETKKKFIKSVPDFFIGIISLCILLSIPVSLYASLYRIYRVDGNLLDKEEYMKICEEYSLDPEKAKIECLFSLREQYGVRLQLNESDLDDLNVLFTEKIFDEDREYRHTTMLLCSESDSMLTAPSRDVDIACGAIIFSENGKHYMELRREDTNNAAIFGKKIKN